MLDRALLAEHVKRYSRC